MTTRGFKQEEVRQVANLIADVLDNPDDADVLDAVRARVDSLVRRFPVYGR
jgi:glycine hydroxymethyltransferase